MNLYRTDFGMSLIGTAMFIDIIIWLMFSVIMVFSKSDIDGISSVIIRVIAIVLFIILIVTVIRLLIDKMLPFIHQGLAGPMGSLLCTGTLLSFSGVAENLVHMPL